MSGQRDPLAIVIAVVGLIVQLGVGFYWSGRLENRVTTVEQRLSRAETELPARAAHDGEQDVKIAVSVAQYTEVIGRLDRIEQKMDTRR